ncbi:hypothetical protein V8V75_23690, partial [Peribacillus frigoritolerans]|uniref:hypothetical protein n=1 Tax=Peribacillus frigoritolerans TaxID=450367 RepID=UPI00300B40C1
GSFFLWNKRGRLVNRGYINYYVEFKYFSRHFVWRFSIANKKINKKYNILCNEITLNRIYRERRKRLGRTR